MERRRMRVAAGAATALLAIGIVVVAVAGAGSAAAADESALPGDAPATGEVVRRTIQTIDVLDGTLGYTGAYRISNLLATATGESAGAGSSSANQAYLSAKAQYDIAVGNRDTLRNPSAADVQRARATLAQAEAALRTAQQGDDGPTAAQLANARASVTQAREALWAATLQRDAAEAALAACPDVAVAAEPPTPTSKPCDRATLELALSRAQSDVRVRQAQLAAVEAAFDGLDDTPANVATNIRSAQASVYAAAAALDALEHPTSAKLRAADNAVAVARAQRDDAALALGLPSGMITAAAEAGTVVEPGGLLYALGGVHAVILLRGEMPAWRRLAPDAGDGPDIGQLERNLAALGFGFATEEPDDHWDGGTTDAVEAFQRSLGLGADGAIELGEIVFLPGPIRVTEVLADLGSTIRAGSPVMTASSTEREVTVDLEADRQAIVTIGARVTVELPDGSETAGTISDIGTVASVAPGSNADPASVPTLVVTVHLDDAGATGSLDGAPVNVNVVRESRANVLAVPVGALLALAEGGYAVEIVNGAGPTRLVGVEIGLFEDGFVEVRSEQLREGDLVVVPS